MLPVPTDDFRRLLTDADARARDAGQEYVGDADLFAAAVSCDDERVRSLLKRHAIDARALCDRVRASKSPDAGRRTSGIGVLGLLPFGASAQAAVTRSIELAGLAGRKTVSPARLLLALLEVRGVPDDASDARTPRGMLRQAGADLDAFTRSLSAEAD